MPKLKLKQVERLEAALKCWEQRLLVVQALYSAPDVEGDLCSSEVLQGSVVNWMTFREKILRRQAITDEHFLTPPPVVERHFSKSLFFNDLPFLIDAWSKTARRVFTLSEDFQRELEMTTLGNISAQDIMPPFQTFGINLPLPIPWELGGVSGTVDFLFVDFEKDGIAIAALGPDTENIDFFLPHKQFRLLKAARKKEISVIQAMIGGANGYPGMPQNLYSTLPITGKPIVQELGADDFDGLFMAPGELEGGTYNELPPFWKTIARVVFSLCIHLEIRERRKTASEIIMREWCSTSTERTVNERFITDSSLICSVGLTEQLSQAKVEAHKYMRIHGVYPKGFELGYQIRKWHRRRPPGLGNDPDARKTIFVGTYEVHPEKKPVRGIPIGAEVLLS